MLCKMRTENANLQRVLLGGLLVGNSDLWSRDQPAAREDFAPRTRPRSGLTWR